MKKNVARRRVCGWEFEDPYDSGNFVTCALPPHTRDFGCANADVARAAAHMLDKRFRLPKKPLFSGGVEGRHYIVTYVIEAVARAIAPKKRPGEDFEMRCEDIAGVIRGPLKDRIEAALIGTEGYSPDTMEWMSLLERHTETVGKVIEEYKAKIAALDSAPAGAKGGE